MNQIVTPAQMKLIEKLSDENNISYSQLMDNAGFQLATEIKNIVNHNKLEKNILFLCGNGNNAGDCFVASKILFNDGFKISVALIAGQPKTELAIKNFTLISEKIYITQNIDDIISIAENSSIIVDGVFGTGFHGELNDNIKKIFSYTKNAFKIAVDIPSGGNAHTGSVADGIFKADITITFGFEKSGMTQYPLKDFCGEIIIADIGITEKVIEKAVDMPMYITDDEFLKTNLKPRKNNCHKGNFGRLLNVCGSTQMSGACMMAGKSALKCGIGILVTASPEKSADRTAIYIPEGMTLPLKADKNGFALCDENYDNIIDQSNKATAMLIGCGLGVTADTRKLVQKLIETVDCPLIIDADGINCIAEDPEIIKKAKHMPILTPHPAEFARLMHCTTAEIQSNRFNSAISFAKKYNVILVLKGAGTIIASPEYVYVNNTGNSGMSRGGSGDVLAGMTASFKAQGLDTLVSAVMAVYIHGLAGDKARIKFSESAMLPTDIINMLGDVFKTFGL